MPEEWSEHKRGQKYTDAAWTTKHGKHHFGYKNHIKGDAGSKLIDVFEVTAANTHDCQVLLELINETAKRQPIWADIAFDSEEIRKALRKGRVDCRIQKKGS